MGLRDKAHLQRALANGTATPEQMREALELLWNLAENLEARIVATRRSVTISADDITLTAGDATIELNKDGSISIRGSGKIQVKGGGDVVLRGSKIVQN